MSRVIRLKRQERVLVDLSDDKTKYLIGWPGYRNAEGRSGLGYFETNAEWAHMQGVFLRRMVTGTFRTRNPIYWVFLAFMGAIMASPLLLFFAGPEGWQGFWHGIAYFGPYSVIGFLLLINVVLSLIGCTDEESITGD